MKLEFQLSSQTTVTLIFEGRTPSLSSLEKLESKIRLMRISLDAKRHPRKQEFAVKMLGKI